MAEVLTAFIKAPRITQVLTIVLCLRKVRISPRCEIIVL